MQLNQICPSCGNNNYFVEYSGQFKYVEKIEKRKFEVLSCTKCGLSRTNPPPYEDDVTAEIYQDFSFNDSYENPILWESFFQQMFKYANLYKPSGKILDIGCGSGFFIQLAKKKGYDTYGVELNKEAVEYARKTFSLNIQNIDLVAANFPDNYFDIITCSQLLEHIAKPNDLLKEIHRILKDDGILMIEVPNFAGFVVKIWKDKWSGFQPQWHIWQFKPKTLSTLLEKNKFITKKIVCKQNIYTGMPQNIFKKIIRITFYKLIEKLTSVFNNSDKLLIVAQKQ